MKLLNAIILLFCLSIYTNSNSQDWNFPKDSIKDMGRKVIVTSDSNFVITSANTPHLHGVTIKINNKGNVIWKVPFGGMDICETADKCLLIANGAYDSLVSHSSGKVTKLDSDGKLLWEKIYSKPLQNEFYKVLESPDSTILAGGFTANKGDSNIYLIKTDKNGKLLWERSFRAKGQYFGRSQDIEVYGSEIYIVSRYSDSLFKSYQVLIKCDKDGNKIWQRETLLPNNTFIQSMKISDKGEIVSIGSSNILKQDLNGNVIWSKEFKDSLFDFYDIDIHGSDYIISGSKRIYENEPLLVRMKEDGQYIWSKTYPIKKTKSNYLFSSVTFAPNDKIIATGYIQAGNGFMVALILDKSETVGIKDIEITNFTILPNPFLDKVIINSEKQLINKIELVNSIGEVILHKNLILPLLKYELDTKQLTSGVYYIRVNGNSSKLIKD